MIKHLTIFDLHEDYETYINGSDVSFPNVSCCLQENDVHYNTIDYSTNYLTFISTQDGTFKFTTNALQYSLDNGTTWTSLAAGTNTPTINAGSKIIRHRGLQPCHLILY